MRSRRRWPRLSQWPPAPSTAVRLWVVTGAGQDADEGLQLAKVGEVTLGFQRQRGAGDLRGPADEAELAQLPQVAAHHRGAVRHHPGHERVALAGVGQHEVEERLDGGVVVLELALLTAARPKSQRLRPGGRTSAP